MNNDEIKDLFKKIKSVREVNMRGIANVSKKLEEYLVEELTKSINREIIESLLESRSSV